MKKSVQLLLCGLAAVSASVSSNVLGDEFNTADEHPDSHWTYAKNGAGWGVKSAKGVGKLGVNECGLGKTVPQSPIDLKNSWPKQSNALDRFSKVYTDQVTKVKTFWNGHTFQVPVDNTGQEIQSFYSHIADTTYGSPQRYNGVQFHFHAGSEHTIEGERQDLEMHTVHLPQDGHKTITRGPNGFIASAMGLMFSVEKPSRSFEKWETDIIDGFFDSFDWPTIAKTSSYNEKTVPKVTYGTLMMYVDMQNRWTYRGSVTTPPCATAVYWNVLKTVYPIKQKHLDLFKTQLNQTPGLAKQGNWREIQPYVEGEKGTKAQIITNETSNAGMLIAVIILALFVFVLLLVVLKLRAQLKAGGAVSSEMGSLKVQPVADDSQNYNTVNEGK